MHGLALSSTPRPPPSRKRTTKVNGLALVTMLALGLGVRLADITSPPFDFHLERQLFSALKARGMYYQWFGNPLPEWMSEFAVRTGRSLPLIEPPLMETFPRRRPM